MDRDQTGSAMSPGRIWVTRQGVHVDRIASAWLIRRFIDPAAQFKFAVGKSYAPQAQELRLDMFEAEFTHAGDSCSFEVLLARVACPAIFRAGANRLVPCTRTKPLFVSCLPAGQMKAFAVELKVKSARVRSRSCPL